MKRQLPPGSEQRLAFDKRKRYALKPRDRTAKSAAFLRVGPGLAHRCLRSTDALERDERPAIVESGQNLGKGSALFAKAKFGGNSHRGEKALTAPGHVTADIVEAGPLDTGRIARRPRCHQDERIGQKRWRCPKK